MLLQEKVASKDISPSQMLTNNYEQYIKDMLELLRSLLIEDVANHKYKTTDTSDCFVKGERCGYIIMELLQRALAYCIDSGNVESLLICLSSIRIIYCCGWINIHRRLRISIHS